MSSSEINSVDKKAYAVIGVVSTLVIAFLFWLIYVNEGRSSDHVMISYLPALNAALNTLTTILLIVGYWFIKNGKKSKHIASMLGATATSACFLISYIIYHHYHGDTKFLGEGPVRPIYFFILITHIVLSTVMVPMIFATLWHGLRGNFKSHKKIAKFTFPIWIYVSITGVAIFFFLKIFN